MTTSNDSSHQIYTPGPNETEFSWRSLVVGCLIGSLVSITNVYFGLQTGWSVGGSLIAAILGYAFFSMCKLRSPYTVLENNITETAGSAAGSMSFATGLMSMVPALHLLGYDYDIFTLYLWGFSVAFLGVFFAVPLRHQLIEVDKLRFPTGTATAEVIKTMHTNHRYESHKGNVLLAWSLVGGAIALLNFFIPPFENMPVMNLLGLSILSTWGFTLLLSPMMVGAGMLMGPRIGISLLIGAVIAWGIIGPLILHFNWVTGGVHDYEKGVQGWLLWTGVSMMVADAAISLGLSWKTILRSFRFSQPNPQKSNHDKRIPTHWWVTGLVISSISAMISLRYLFSIPPYMTAIAILLSWGLAMIATRASGETDINPASAFAKITQLVYGGISPGHLTMNLHGAGITAAGAAAAGDMMGDLKTGYLLGASPRKQFIAQCAGIFSGVCFSIPIYKLFDAAYQIGGPRMPAPGAQSWKAMAQVLTTGFDALPEHALFGVVLGCVVGCLIPILRKYKRFEPYTPSGVAIGIAFIIPAFFPLAMFLGSMAFAIWNWLSPGNARNLSFAVASGLIVGEGLMGVARAIMTLGGIEPWITTF